jgi:hypothetical protein
MLKISIPVPCHQDWGAMTPTEQGRHCTSCAKTVIDFTSMSDDEVKYFFINKKEEKICGRFKNEQLHRIVIELPHNIFYITMPGWKKFLVASLVAFSTTIFSCDIKVKGDVIAKKEKIETIAHRTMDESIECKTIIDTTVTLPPPVCTATQGNIIPLVIVGEIQAPLPIVPTTTGDSTILYNTTMGTPAIITLPEKMGEIEILKSDSSKSKNLLKTDSINCSTQTFY